MPQHDGGQSTVSGTIEIAGYVLILICRPIDYFQHNDVFAQELRASFAAEGLETRVCDYRTEIRMVLEALNDTRCRFMVCFNGFGSELAFSQGTAGALVSAYEATGKPLFDLMHDCPSHDSMSHQMLVRTRRRHILLTDHGYIQEAQELGFPDARFVPSITFPLTLPTAPPMDERSVSVLLPIQIQPNWTEHAFGVRGDAVGLAYQAIIDYVCKVCEADLSRDPRAETRAACRQAGLMFDVNRGECRTLLTGVLDRVKAQRRRSLIAALHKLPVTMVTTAAEAETTAPDSLLRFTEARSFPQLLQLMTNSRIVLCPLPHMTGWHERALGAFTAGAAVVAAPNEQLEVNFKHSDEMLIYRSSEEAADIIADLLRDPERMEALARAGQEKAMQRYSPAALASTIMGIWRVHYEQRT